MRRFALRQRARFLVLALFLVPFFQIPALAAGTFVDDDGNPHEVDIEAIAAAGITQGCNPPVNDRYCPRQPVTRGQMAAFLVRTLDIPSSTADFFIDDGVSIFEADINAIAAAGITSGCAAGRYCPDGQVVREEMAAFLARALSLPTAESGDQFNDDDNSPFEAFIDSLAEAGITTGCAGSKFCPRDLVLRDQMATFLARSLALPPATFACTLVVGFSQTREWFSAGQFEQILPNGQWELLWHAGAEIQLWADPNYVGWRTSIVSACSTARPDRILLTISGEGRSVAEWVIDIQGAVATARAKYSDAIQVVLQPVVGGPGHSLCEFQGEVVRASSNHPVIDQAIAKVISGGNKLVAGYSPEVRGCEDFADVIGHLVDSAEGPIGASIGQFYLKTP